MDCNVTTLIVEDEVLHMMPFLSWMEICSTHSYKLYCCMTTTLVVTDGGRQMLPFEFVTKLYNIFLFDVDFFISLSFIFA